MNVRITLVVLSNKFAQCDYCKSKLNGFLLFPYAVFLDLRVRLVRHDIIVCSQTFYFLKIVHTANTVECGQGGGGGEAVKLRARTAHSADRRRKIKTSVTVDRLP